MRFVFIRHGDPDYTNDCLTEVGHKQAEAVALRLSEEEFCGIYSSTCGRAMQTAEHIASKHKVSIETCDFMRELKWGANDKSEISFNGHPWFTVDEMVEAGIEILNQNWYSKEPFCRNTVISSVNVVSNGFDNILSELGYVREGDYYRVQQKNKNTYAMVSHGGSSSAVISHLFNLPFPFFCSAVHPDLTSITIVLFEGETGQLIAPRIEIMNDSRHIKSANVQNIFDN